MLSKKLFDKMKNMMELNFFKWNPHYLRVYIDITSKSRSLLRYKNEKWKFRKKADKPKIRNGHKFFNGTMNFFKTSSTKLKK